MLCMQTQFGSWSTFLILKNFLERKKIIHFLLYNSNSIHWCCVFIVTIVIYIQTELQTPWGLTPWELLVVHRSRYFVIVLMALFLGLLGINLELH